jgi:hypothetical protein
MASRSSRTATAAAPAMPNQSGNGVANGRAARPAAVANQYQTG